MKRSMVLFLTVSFLLGCSSSDDVRKADYVGKTFDHRFFDTLQECLDAQPDPNFFINCHQQLSFIDLETAEISLTDIIYRVDYSVFGNRVTLRSGPNTLEFQQDIVFERISDSSLRRISDNSVWYERNGDDIWE
ncbi:hypothetical protein ACFQ1M_07205 [Sungkyunkwania multivorans]|uniref:Lipoprotein n=1 Tax=Sungkyunkwania multivorans TaxID=1173618 RepID=A0ABW3CW44_9FLAO